MGAPLPREMWCADSAGWEASWGQTMMGWRIWVLVFVALGIALWASFGLVLPGDEKPSSIAVEMLGQSDGKPNAHAEQIRQESRNALREVLLDADEKDGESR